MPDIAKRWTRKAISVPAIDAPNLVVQSCVPGESEVPERSLWSFSLLDENQRSLWIYNDCVTRCIGDNLLLDLTLREHGE
jgi:hypothetical protein